MVTSTQIYAARILAKWSRDQLASASGMNVDTLTNIEERGIDPSPPQERALKRALEGAGVKFIAERGALGAGVRLKFSSQTVKSIQRLENEGGPARDDDVT
jgi:transcriptional regulator with XRE-family HTH domain